jgi:hypothetical protein
VAAAGQIDSFVIRRRWTMLGRTHATPTRLHADPHTTLPASRGWGPIPTPGQADAAAVAGHDFGGIAVHSATAPAQGSVIQRAHTKYTDPKQRTPGFVKPQKLFELYRSVDPASIDRIKKAVQSRKGPDLHNKVRDKVREDEGTSEEDEGTSKKGEGTSKGENFFAESRAYAEGYKDKGTRKGGSTMRIRLDPGIKEQLLMNPRYARLHNSAEGYFKGIPKAKPDERGTVLVKKEGIGKQATKSTNYGIRESEDPKAPDNPYTIFNRAIHSIDILPREQNAQQAKKGKKEKQEKKKQNASVQAPAEPERIYTRLQGVIRRRKAAPRQGLAEQPFAFNFAAPHDEPTEPESIGEKKKGEKKKDDG